LSRLAAISGRDLVAALGRIGFEELRTRGSHRFLRHSDGRATVVPVHSNEDLGRGLVGKILRDVKLSGEELRKLL
jgi:predicted RNA binding protein YcfA (HicA-like mRNA interferase family)